MEFKEAYGHFMDGSASDEEAEYVRNEIRIMREVSRVIESEKPADIFSRADEEAFKKAKKNFNLRATIKTILIVFAVVALIAAGICGYIFGTAIPAAKRSMTISRADAVELGKEFLLEQAGLEKATLVVHDVDRHLDSANGLKNSIYRYVVEYRDGWTEYEVSINAATGYCQITDIDRR